MDLTRRHTGFNVSIMEETEWPLDHNFSKIFSGNIFNHREDLLGKIPVQMKVPGIISVDVTRL